MAMEIPENQGLTSEGPTFQDSCIQDLAKQSALGGRCRDEPSGPQIRFLDGGPETLMFPCQVERPHDLAYRLHA